MVKYYPVKGIFIFNLTKSKFENVKYKSFFNLNSFNLFYNLYLI